MSSSISGDSFVDCVASVKCKDTDLWHDDLRACRLPQLHSESTPIHRNAITVHVNPVEGYVRRPARSAFALMMAPRVACYLEYTPETLDGDSSSRPPLDQLVKNGLRNVWHEIGLGYYDEPEKQQLESYCNKLSNVLCCVYSHWEKFFRSSFPKIPNKEARKGARPPVKIVINVYVGKHQTRILAL